MLALSLLAEGLGDLGIDVGQAPEHTETIPVGAPAVKEPRCWGQRPAPGTRSAPARPPRRRRRPAAATSSRDSTASAWAGVIRVSGWAGTNSVQQSASGSIEISKVPSCLASSDDLDLVDADQRPQDRPLGGVVDGGDVLERLRGHLPQALAGGQRQGTLAPADRLGDADHQSAIDDDAGRAAAPRARPRAGSRRRAPGTGASRTATGQPLDERPGLGLRGRRQVRHAVEVHEHRPAAALQHPPRRHRRVDAARQRAPPRCPPSPPAGRRGRAAARARRTPRPGAPPPRSPPRGRSRSTRVVHALEHEGAERAVQLDAGQRIRLEGPAGADAERPELAPLDEPTDHALHPLQRRGRAVAEGDTGHAAHAPGPLDARPPAAGARRGRARSAPAAGAPWPGRRRRPRGPGCGRDDAGRAGRLPRLRLISW